MASSTWDLEVETTVAGARLMKGAILDWHNLGPKIAPEIIASGTPLSGDGGVGSVRQINFTSATLFGYEFVKERLDLVDHDKLECEQALIGGGVIGTKLESASSHYNLVPTGSGGCVVKVVTTLKTLPGVEIDEEELKHVKKGVTGMFKAVEAHLLANPTAYA